MSNLNMQVDLQPFEIQDLAECNQFPTSQVFGDLKRPKDPDIRSLFEWEEKEDNKIVFRNRNNQWATEYNDSYKGFILRPIQNTETQQAEQPQYETILNSGLKIPKALSTQKSQVRDQKEKQQQQDKPTQKQVREVNTISSKPESQINTIQSQQKRSKKLKKSLTLKELNSKKRTTKRRKERVDNFHRTTRWLPNSAFTSYYGKPAFANYGIGNTNPVVGGFLYGDYLLSHNVSPHEAKNNPQYTQVYSNAEKTAMKKKQRQPEPPRKCKEEFRLNQAQVQKLKKRNPILPKSRKFPSRDIVKPELIKTKRFASVQGSEKEEEDSIEFTESNFQAPTEPTQFKSTQNVQETKATSLGRTLVEQQINQPQEIFQQPAEEFSEIIDTPPSYKQPEIFTPIQNNIIPHQNPTQYKTTYQHMSRHLPQQPQPLIPNTQQYCSSCYLDRPPQELNPKLYKYTTPQTLSTVPSAGQLTCKSPSAYSVMFYDKEYI